MYAGACPCEALIAKNQKLKMDSQVNGNKVNLN